MENFTLQIKENFYVLSEGKIGNIKNQKIVIDLKDIDFHGTAHSAERQIRKDNLAGKDISTQEIQDTIQKAIGQIISDYANGEIDNSTKFLINDKKTNVNIIGALRMQKGKDFLTVITVMRKKGFKTDAKTVRYEV